MLKTYRIMAASALMLAPAGLLSQSGEPSGVQPKNIILMIGDGMGLNQATIPYFYGDQSPAFDRFRHIGLSRTTSGSDLVTQSSAASTAISTGMKTYNRAIGVDMDTIPRKNLVERVSERGVMTGVISTSSVTDATPAGFYSHQPDRYMHHEIALDLTRSEVDFFAGGGIKHFIDTTGTDHFKANGIQVNFGGLIGISDPRPGDRYGFLLGSDRLPTMLEGRGSFLQNASRIAIDFLSTGEYGFFLMIEGSQIDWAGHGNQADYMIAEVLDFNEAVNSVLDFAEDDGETLVIVTADHETGGFTLAASGEEGYEADYSVLTPRFATTNHSASLVPVFAYGPGSEEFQGVYDNTDIFWKMARLMAVVPQEGR